MQRKGFGTSTPILRPLDNIENRDALIEQDAETGEWREAEWPEADVIVGNPPFLGVYKIPIELGAVYNTKLRQIYAPRIPNSVDLVVYWLQKGGEAASRSDVLVGFVTTNSVRGGSNRRQLNRVLEQTSIFRAFSDEPWIVDGASVRVSIICLRSVPGAIQLNGSPVEKIGSNLEAPDQFDVSSAARLTAMKGVCVRGIETGGPFEIDLKSFRDLARQPTNPNGRGNTEVLVRHFEWNRYPESTAREICHRFL